MADTASAAPAAQGGMPTTRTLIATGGREFRVVVSEQTEPPPERPPIPPAPPLVRPIQSAVAKGLSAADGVFTLCNSAIGAGVLALPFAFELAGLFGGLIICVGTAVVEGATLYVLSKLAEKYECATYGSLVRRTLGRKMAALLAVVMTFYLWGSCVAYQIIIGDTFSAVGALLAGPDSPLASRTVLILGVSTLLLLPMCLLRRLSHLAWLSAVAVAGFTYSALVIVCVGVSATLARRPTPLEGVVLWRWDAGLAVALPIVVFGFNCHANVVSIFSELDHEGTPLLGRLSNASSYWRLPSGEPRGGGGEDTGSPAPPQPGSAGRSRRLPSIKLINMISVIVVGVGFILVSYGLVGTWGYVGFRGAVGGNVLNALPADNVWVQVAQGATGMVVLLHFPLNHHPARAGVYDALHLLDVPAPPAWLADLFTVLFVGGSTGLALAVTSLGDALHIVGGLAGSLIIFMLPGLMLVNESVVKHSNLMLESLQQDPEGMADTLGLQEPLLRQAATKGIKKTGLVYSPRRSWAMGMCLVVLATAVFVMTLLTV